MGCTAHWDEKLQVIRLGDRYARGLVPTLYAEFSSHYSVTQATHEDFSNFNSTKKNRINDGRKNRLKGRYVDDALRAWTLNIKPSKRWKLVSDEMKWIRQAFEANRWQPVEAQFAVGCVHLRLGTKIDLMVRDQHHRLILVEVKYGCGDYTRQIQGRFSSPLQDWPLCAYYRYFLQLLVTTWLFLHGQHQYSSETFGGSYVLKIDSEQVELVPLPVWTFADRFQLQKIIEKLESHTDLTVQQRKRVCSKGASSSTRKWKKAKV